MTPPKNIYHDTPEFPRSVAREVAIEYGFIGTLQKLNYEYRKDITNCATLEANFRGKFEALMAIFSVRNRRISSDQSVECEVGKGTLHLAVGN